MSKAKKIVAAIVGILVLAGAVVVAQIGPSNIIGMLRYDQRKEGSLGVGDVAPDVELLTVDGKTKQKLATYWTDKPVVLVFGSFT